MRTQLGPIQGIDGRARPAMDRYVLERNGALDRFPDLTGLTGTPRQDEIDDFLAGEDLVGYYPLEASGSVSTTYPLTTDNEGRCPDAWFPPGSYDHYAPDDLLHPLERWEAIAFGGIVLGRATIDDPDTQTGVGSKDVAGLSVTVTVGNRPIVVILDGSTLSNTSASGWGAVKIQEGATVLGSVQVVLTTLPLPVHREADPDATPGTRTFKVVLTQVLTGNTTLSASATEPVTLRVVEV